MTNKIHDLLKKIRSGKKSSPPEHQDRSVSQEEEEDSTKELNLDEIKLTVKDRFQEKVRSLKDGLNRMNISKFRTMKLEQHEESETSTTPSKTKLINKGLDNLNLQSLKKFQQQLFSPQSWNKIHKLFQVSFIFGLIFLIGKTASLFTAGLLYKEQVQTPSTPPSIENDLFFTELRNARLFRTDSTEIDEISEQPDFTQEIACSQASRQSSLPIRLLNTVVLQDSIKSIASVQVRSGRELTQVREGDNLNGMAKVDRIERQRIIVKNLENGNCESIENLSEPPTRGSNIALMSPQESKQFTQNKDDVQGIKNEGNSFTIEKNFIQDKMKNISDVLTQARGIQMTNPDGSLSFKIVEVEPGGIFSYLGIQNNDVITQINGQKITNLNEVMSLFGKISNVDKMNLTINRNGEEVPLEYNIK